MNPIYASDLVKDDGEIAKIHSQLVGLEKVYVSLLEKAKAEAIELNKKVEVLNETEATHHETIKETSKLTDELAKRVNKYEESLGENAVKIAAVKEAQRQLNNVNKLEAKLLASKEGSYNALSAQYSLLKIRINQLSTEERKNTKEGREMVTTSKAIYEEMKTLQAETGKTSLNVGNYADALREVPGPAGAVVEGVKNIGKSFKALLANPLVLFFTLIVGAVVALGKAFLKSEDGVSLMAKATGILNAFMGQLVEISVKVKDAIVSAFNDPQQALKDIGKLLLEQVINRISSIPLLVLAAGKAFNALARGDLKTLKEAGEDAGYALTQAITGLDRASQQSVVDAIKETIVEVTAEANAWIKLEQAKINVANANRALTRSIERLTTVEETQQAISDDATRSFLEREKAAEAAREALEERYKLEIQLAKNNANLINQEIGLRKANKESIVDLLDQQLNAFKEVAGAERAYTLAVLQNEKERSELKQDRLERDLDILLDGYDNQQMINERLIKDDRLTFDKRKSILLETVRLSDESFARQIDTIQQFTGVAIDANEFIGESDAILLNSKIRALGLSEIIEGRLLEIIRDRKTANRDLIEAGQELSDAEIKFYRAKADLALKAKKKDMENALEGFDQQQALNQSSFDLLKTSENKKTVFRIRSEQERLQKILDINEKFSGDLTDIQIDTIKNQIAKLSQDLEKTSRNRSIFELLGINVDDDQKSSLKTVFSTIKDQVLDFYAFRKQQADKNVEVANREVEEAQRNLQIEQENQRAGFEQRIQLREKELIDARRTQDKALREQEKAARKERQIQTVQQTTNLITASTKIWKDFGFPLAIPFIGLMFGAFLANKIKAGQLAKQEYGEGGWEKMDFGGSHASGNDIPIGRTKDGRQRTMERGEILGIFSRRAVGKYGSLIPNMVDMFNNGNFEIKNRLEGGGVSINATGPSMAKTESELTKIRQQNERQTYFSPDGSVMVVSGQNTRVYR